jgi:ORF6N domain
MPKAKRVSPLTVEPITRAILILRGHRVILDHDLAPIYGVTTKRLNEQVKRNTKRFPDDFMFRLTLDESDFLRSRTATSKIAAGRGGRRYLPYAFTEHGAIQAANVLNSLRAVEMSVYVVYVVRAFVQLREMLASNEELAKRLDELEARIEKKLTTHDEAIAAMLSAIRALMTPPAPKRRGIGFAVDLDDTK